MIHKLYPTYATLLVGVLGVAAVAVLSNGLTRVPGLMNIASELSGTGTKAADYTPAASNYGQNQVIQTGPQGGTYYINSNGNKTYVPRRR